MGIKKNKVNVDIKIKVIDSPFQENERTLWITHSELGNQATYSVIKTP